MRYEFKLPPQDPKGLPDYLGHELLALARALSGPADVLRLSPLAAAPIKPRDGDLIYANGTTFNPGGTGAGIYARVSGAWVKL